MQCLYDATSTYKMTSKTHLKTQRVNDAADARHPTLQFKLQKRFCRHKSFGRKKDGRGVDNVGWIRSNAFISVVVCSNPFHERKEQNVERKDRRINYTI